MRIAHVGVEIVPSENGAYVGGLVKDVATVASWQVQHGHDVTVFTSDANVRIADGARTSIGGMRRIPTRGAYGSMRFATTFLVRGARELRRAHREAPFDVVHVHSAYASLGAIAHLLRRVEAPRAFSLYSPNFRASPGHDHSDGRNFLRNRLARASLARFGTTIVPSENLRRRLRQIGLPDEGSVQVPPALDPAMSNGLPTQEAAREALGLPHDAPIVLFLGNYSPWKGADVLLHAFHRIRRDAPDAILLTAWGEPYEWSGNQRGNLLGLIDSLGLAGAVRQFGILGDVRLALRAADVLASPFRCTCKVLDYPLSILEAMACERPVVATRVGGIPELLRGDGRGLLVTPGDVEALGAALGHTLGDPKLARDMGLRGRRWVHERFLDEDVGRSLEAVYASLAEGGAGPQPDSVPSPN